MKGRFYGRKKSIILLTTAIVMLFSFVFLSILAFCSLKMPELWFFNFCLCVGFYELIRSFLFNIDNSFYLGSLLFLTGVTGYLILFFNISQYTSAMIMFCFSLASTLTHIFYRQKFHLVIAFSCIFVTIFLYLLSKNMITLQIFIAFVTSFLVLLTLAVISNIKWRR